MMPDHVLSSVPIRGEFLFPDSITPELPTLDFELGGVDIQDPSQGLQVKRWAAYIQGQDIVLAADDRPPVVWFSRLGTLTEVSLAFDQNMRPAIAFVEDGLAWLYWYNTMVGTFVYTSFDGAVTPRVCLDDKRDAQNATSDILLAYVKDNNLYFRAQRDRFTIEYLLKTDVFATLIKLGMTTKNRVQFLMKPAGQ